MVFVAAEDGTFIDQNHAYIAELVQEFDPGLRLCFISESRRDVGDQPFAVMGTDRQGQDYIVLLADACDERILERLYRADNSRHDVMSQMDAKNLAARLMSAKRIEDEKALKSDFAKSVLQSPLHTYRHNGRKYD